MKPIKTNAGNRFSQLKKHSPPADPSSLIYAHASVEATKVQSDLHVLEIVSSKVFVTRAWCTLWPLWQVILV
jgi:hypothetical protein